MILGDLIWRITGDTSDFDKKVPAAEKKATAFATGLKGVAKAAASTFATIAADLLILDKFQKAFAEDELASIRLTAALKTSAQVAPSAIKRFDELAKSLQETSIFEDDAVKTQAAYLASLGKTEDQINKVILAAADLAAATGMSLDTAVQQLNATLVGNAGYLGRQNAAVRALTEEELKAGKAIDIVSKQYEGYAKAVGESAFGGNEQFKNSINDLKEAVGRLIQSSGWKELQQFVGKLAKGATGEISKTLDLNEALKANKKGVATDEQKLLILEYQYGIQQKQVDEAYTWVEATKKGTKAREEAVKLYNSELDKLFSISNQHKEIEKIISEKEAKEKKAAGGAAKRQKEEEDAAEKKKKSDEAEKKRLEDVVALNDHIATQNKNYNDLLSQITTQSGSELDQQEQAMINQIYSTDIAIDKMAELIVLTRQHFNQLREDEAFEKYKQNYMSAFNFVSSAFEELGNDLGKGELSWKSFAKVGLQAIAQILEALGLQAAANAAKSYADWASSKFIDASALAAAVGYTGASVAAYSGAGIVRGYAGSFKEGGVIGGNVYNDGLVARVSSGEEIVNQNDRTQLIDYLKNSKQEQTIIVPLSIDGREVARVVARYQTKGKV